MIWLHDGYLTGSEDFIAIYPIQFSGRHTRASYNIMIINNEKLEDTETFNVSIDPLCLPCGIVLGDNTSAEVVILDDDSKCTIIIHNLHAYHVRMIIL